MRGSVTVHIDVMPDVVWALVSDVTRIGEFSPETFEAQWLDDADGPHPGARFRGHVRRNGVGPVYWTTCRVTECVPGRTFAFAVEVAGRAVNTWRYEIAAAKDGGSDVMESFALTPTPAFRVYWRLLGRARERTNLRGMRETLERMKSVLEAGPPSSCGSPEAEEA